MTEEDPKTFVSPTQALKNARMSNLMNNYETQLIETRKKEDLIKQVKNQELDNLRKQKDDFLQLQVQSKIEKKTMQSNLASHYEQMTNYQKALKEREKQQESIQAERLKDENIKALEAEKLKKRAKIEEYKQQQFEFLRQKEEEKLKNLHNDDFKKSGSTNIFNPRFKSEDYQISNAEKQVFFEDKSEAQNKKLEQKNRYKSFLEQQVMEKNQEKEKKKEIYLSQAELNLKKNEEYKEFQKQEFQKRREEQLKYREFLNIQNSEKNDPLHQGFNSTNQSLVQLTPNIKQNNEKNLLFQNPDQHNPLLNPMPFNVQNPYLFKNYKKGILSQNYKQNAYFANIANSEIFKNY